MNIKINNENRVLFDFCGVPLSLTASGDHGWRLQSARYGIFDDFGAGQILARDLSETPRIIRNPIKAEDRNDTCRITADDRTSVLLSPDAIRFYDAAGKEKEVLTAVSDNGCDSTVTGILREGERLYGTGERFNVLNQRGKRIDIMAIDEWCKWEGNSYVPIPILISSLCAGLFMNRNEHAVFDLGKENPDFWKMEQKEAPIDLYVFLGSAPGELLYAYEQITGFAPVPSDWLYGTQVCRYYPDFSTVDGVMDMAARMKENDFPWDAVILEGWPTYDKNRFDELKEMTKTLHDMGKKVMVYQACGRVPGNAEEMFGMKPEYVLANGATGERRLPETASYNPADNPNPRSAAFLDITSKEALDWWQGPVWGTLVDEIGIDGAKIDFCEQFPDHLPVAFSDGREVHGAHHWYPTLYNVLMYQKYARRPEGGMCLSRGGGTGAQRYPFLWAGDQLREYKFLKIILRGVLSAGLSGIPFMSYDMSAYRPAKDQNENPEDAVFVRGLEYTAFSANIQTHGIVKRPYDFDDHIKDVYRAYAKLHDALRPYLSEQGRIASETAMPLMRHLFLYDCTDPMVYDIEDEYMLGDSLLIAPVLDPVTARNVYLPRGEWENIFTGEHIHGNTTLENVPVPLESVCVYRLIGSASKTIDGVLKAAKPYLDEISCLAR